MYLPHVSVCVKKTCRDCRPCCAPHCTWWLVVLPAAGIRACDKYISSWYAHGIVQLTQIMAHNWCSHSGGIGLSQGIAARAGPLPMGHTPAEKQPSDALHPVGGMQVVRTTAQCPCLGGSSWQAAGARTCRAR
jgi:hypothetical protein